MKNLRLKLLLLCVMGIITLGASATPDKNYLCFTANTANSTVELVKNGKAYNVIMQYSTDEGESWQTIDFETETTTGTITLEKANDKVYFRNIRPASDVTGFSKDYKDGYNHYQFVMSGSIAASGNVMSLVDSDVETTTIPNKFCFTYLFYDCSALTSAPELPATTLQEDCYYDMFVWCTGLTEAPELPATNLAERCYEEMFVCCTSLTEAPTLPANDLEKYCYFRMFEYCTSLTEAPALNAMNLAEDCYLQMFFDCTGLKSAPALPATELKEDCYMEMFRGCTALTSAPELPATELAGWCYAFMFMDTGLTEAPELPAENLADWCYCRMFQNTSLTKAPELPATTLYNGCYYNMFAGCKSLTKAPELPATTLCNGCYTEMFNGCTSLKSIKVGFTEWYQKNVNDEEDYDATDGWLAGVGTDGVFICPDALDKTQTGANYIPTDWTPAYEVKANKDPESVNYYSTFYSGTNAYEVPSGVTAYTGVAEGNVLNLTAIESGIIPAKEPVILKASQSQVYLQYTAETGTNSTDNMLEGTDEETALSANQYALSLGQKGVGFYLWSGKEIGANKAYLTLESPTMAKAFTFQFDDGETTAIEQPTINGKQSGDTYNLNGVRVNDNYKGIVIKNGKKIYQK